jgi:RNA polymerase sigma-54 factor
MALTQRLEIRQSHALVMTPQLMQAIKLLQLSNLDLATYVETELERNPLLERTGDGEGDVPAASAAETRAERDGAAAAETSGGADWQGEDSGEPRAAAEDGRDSPLDQGFDEADAVAPRAAAEMPPG